MILGNWKNGLRFALALTLFLSPVGNASYVKVDETSMREVLSIAKAITVVQPNLENSKYLEYALAVHRASSKYGIEPSVLIAIAQQESGFREKLPEGAAGEIGMLQIRKHWVMNSQFIQEFGRVPVRNLEKASKAFLYAAWILSNLREAETQKGTLPYWSFYNSRRFENRLNYFLRVNKKLSALRKYAQAVFRIPASSKTLRVADTQKLSNKPQNSGQLASNGDLVSRGRLVDSVSPREARID